jgi:hypothetical protein
MRDEFRGNFTRDTSDNSKQFSRVLFKQGKVLLDSDFNELQDILTNYLRTLTIDLIGRHGGPANGFRIVNLHEKYDEKGLPVAEDDQTHSTSREFAICPGHYYVDGILCENFGKAREKGKPLPLNYRDQEGYPFPGSLNLDSRDNSPGKYLVYLDVWERTISSSADDSIREKALGGIDTAVRSKIVWQVKTMLLKDVKKDEEDEDIFSILSEIIDFLLGEEEHHEDTRPNWSELTNCRNRNRGELKAQVKQSEEDDEADNYANPCVIHADAGSMISENCLYRIEIHKPGKAGDNATFKWARRNGSNDLSIFPVETSNEDDSDTALIKLKGLSGVRPLGIYVGDWVEIIDDNYILRSNAFPLWRVDSISEADASLILKRTASSDKTSVFEKNPILRKWEHKEGRNPDKGGIQLLEGAAKIEEGKWLFLENGIQIQFQPGGNYRTGDYWLIPARVETGDIEWPKQSDNTPAKIPPHGIEHHCAPLAVIYVAENRDIFIDHDCRKSFGNMCVLHGTEHQENRNIPDKNQHFENTDQTIVSEQAASDQVEDNSKTEQDSIKLLDEGNKEQGELVKGSESNDEKTRDGSAKVDTEPKANSQGFFGWLSREVKAFFD